MNSKQARKLMGVIFSKGHLRALKDAGNPVVEGKVSFVMLDRSRLKTA